ncbi:hypothetical protein PG913_07740 [Tenacibaculum pacificus]|uniref:hypothetical protein n=1 Tax=Tenacibaculum pacificus TaxID=3018314 RepID=UPI0022F3AA61|nr:hypothetical protein [Tenacibaculum pacificus]WBX72799.1 hypothetical protein PG913_07740 [Tenacibaculum pacificus]
MKKYYSILLTFLCFTIITSCNDEEVISDKNPDDEINQTEETVLKADTVTKNLLIEGAELKAGTPPASNGNISFSVKETEQSAFLNKGFKIGITTNDNFDGAYILVKSTDNEKADSYFDIPNTPPSYNKKNTKTKSRFSSKKIKTNFEDNEIEVNFTNNIQPGKFCYFVCIYNNQGYVSAPTEVCVEVEAWGGNTALVGTWNFSKEIKTIENKTKTILLNQEDCDEGYIYCGNQKELVVDNAYCHTIKSLPLTFNADGTYEFENKVNSKNLDYNASMEACSAIIKNEETTYQSKGNWAYNEDEDKLTLVEFEYIEDINGTINKKTYVNGELSIVGLTTFTNSELIITDEYTDENYNEEGNIEVITEKLEYFFTKQ